MTTLAVEGALGRRLRVVARIAEALLVRPRITAAPSERLDVIDDVGRSLDTAGETQPAERFLCNHLGAIALTSTAALARCRT